VAEVRRTQRRRVAVTFAADVELRALADLGTVLEAAPRRVVLLVAQDGLAALVARLAQLPLSDLVVEPPSLEDAFLERYR
jgi:hypothetical protein